MQRIFNIEKWSEIPQGKAMRFDGDRPRRVHLEVNSPGKTKLTLIDEQGTPRFLALVEGRDTLEFFVQASFGLVSTGSDCFVYTVDGDGVSFEALDPASFTVIREARERNYELEYIAARMAENMNRRLEQQAHELRAVLERRIGSVGAQSAPTSPPAGHSVPPVEADDEGQPESDTPPRKRGRPPANRD